MHKNMNKQALIEKINRFQKYIMSLGDVVAIRKKLDKIFASEIVDWSSATQLLEALSSIPVDVDILKQSKIGLTLNLIRKNHKNTKVGSLAKEMRECWMKEWDDDAAKRRNVNGSSVTNVDSHVAPSPEKGDTTGVVDNTVADECGVVVVFKAVMCLTQRARFDVTVSTENLELSGKSVQYTIPLATVKSIFLLPDSNNAQSYFMIELDVPMKRGKTEYKTFVFTLSRKISLTHELFMNQIELDLRYQGKLKKHMSGLESQVISTVIEAAAGKKLITLNSSDECPENLYIPCSHKTDSGLLYFLEESFVFLPKPSLHLKFEDINSIEFGRGDGYNRSFDLVINASSKRQIHFSIEKEQYGFIQSFLQQKKLIRS